MKNIRFILLPLLCTPLLSGCNTEPKHDVTSNIVKFTNTTDEYDVKGNQMTLYYVDEGNVPYVDVLTFLKELNGFIDNDVVYYQMDNISHCLNINFEYSGIIYKGVSIDWRKDLVSGGNNVFRLIVSSTEATDYGSHIKNVDTYMTGTSQKTYDLGGYGFDVIKHKDKVLMPLVIANTLFCSQNYYNVFFNGDEAYGCFYEVDRGNPYYSQIRQSSFNGENCPEDLREATVNSLLFILDNYYGLKKYKNIDHFRNYISKSNMDKLYSINPEDNFSGIVGLVYDQLDELHTRINIPSYYAPLSVNTNYPYGNRRTAFWNRWDIQEDLRNQTFPDGVPPVRYSGDTAIITLDGFTTGSKAQLFDDQGNLKDDAWKYDSYYYMRYCMDDIKEHNGINDIILDLSLNGGGNVAAMERVLGFLSDETLSLSILDTLTNQAQISYFQVDTDGNNDYDNDAYDNYHWSVLTSMNTFSAANCFTSIAKQHGIAKIIGQTSGGGMCAVSSMVLADGTGFTMSSTTTLRYVKVEDGKKVFYGIEDGIVPDMNLDYQYYFDDNMLVTIADLVKEQ